MRQPILTAPAAAAVGTAAQPNPLMQLRARHLVLACASLALAISVLVLAGWATHTEWLMRLGFHGVAVKPWTAVGLCLIALAMLAGHNRPGHRLAIVLLAVVVAIAVFVLLETALGFDVGFDELLAADPEGNGRPATNTAIALLLIATAGLIGDRHPLAAQGSAAGGGLVSFVALLGYGAGAEELSGLGAVTMMAVATSIALTLLAFAMLLSRTAGGPFAILLADGPRGAQLRRLLPVAALGPIALSMAGTMLADSGAVSRASSEWLTLVVLTAVLVGAVVRQAAAAEKTMELERASARTARVLQEVADRSPSPIFVKDLEGQYLLTNRAHQQLPGPAHASNSHELEALRAGEATEFVEAIPTVDGERFFLSTRFPLFDADGTAFAVGGVATDITEMQRSETRLRALSEGLEQNVARRTRQLEATNHELQTFSYSVSHDLRAPLRAIDAFSQLVLESDGDALSASGRAHLERVCAASARMAELIDALLKLSRLGRQPMGVADVDVSALATEVAEELLAAEPRAAGTEIIIAPGLSARADPPLLRTALVNLIGNAIKFSGHVERPRVEVGRAEEEDGPVFFVRDNGAGFDSHHADKLFSPFQRLHSPREFTGNGVGLATVQRIVLRHNGRVWAQSAPDQGATFFFTLAPDSDERSGTEPSSATAA